MNAYFLNYKQVDCYGKPVERSKYDYPYSYSDHLQWVKSSNYISKNMPKNCTCNYSDRIYQFDSVKYDKACREVWNNEGQFFGDREPEEIEKFLSIYSGKPVELLKVGECCNMSSGYPIWIFWYRFI